MLCGPGCWISGGSGLLSRPDDVLVQALQENMTTSNKSADFTVPFFSTISTSQKDSTANHPSSSILIYSSISVVQICIVGICLHIMSVLFFSCFTGVLVSYNICLFTFLIVLYLSKCGQVVAHIGSETHDQRLDQKPRPKLRPFLGISRKRPRDVFGSRMAGYCAGGSER